jgi:tetratricopeptide (TPR) repeat protein
VFTDVRGLALSTGSEAAVSAYDEAVGSYFEYRLKTGKCVKQALDADPGFAMAHCLQGYLFMLFGTNAVLDKARAALQAAEAGAHGITRREAGHIAALGTWLGGDMARTCALWDEVLVEHPRDLLALRLQHFALFWMGRSAELRGAPARVLYAWDAAVPGYGNVLGMLAFGHEECGAYAEAEAMGKQAVEFDPEDLWALHAVAHVFEMQGRLAEGLAWLDYPADAWDDRNPFKGHLWWHRALFLLERGDHDAALALYDRAIRPDPSGFYLDVQNASALLARLEFLGVDVGARWSELAEQLETRLDDHVLAFTDASAMMALAAAGCAEAAETFLASLEAFAATPGNTAAETMAPVTIPVCEAILAYGRGAYGRAVELLLAHRHGFIAMGASHAQRDVFQQYLIEAAIRDGRLALARALLSERTLAKPNNAGAWLKYAAVLDGLGDADAAVRARERGSRAGGGA